MSGKVSARKLNTELKNSLFTDTERFEMFFAANWKKIAAAAVAVAVLIAASVGLWGWHRGRIRQAEFLLSDAVTIEELSAALEKYPDHAGADSARLRLARQAVDDGKFDLASAQLTKIVSNGKADPTLQDQARLLQGYVSELQGKPAVAGAQFKQIAAEVSARPAVRAEAAYAAARIFAQMKDVAAAKGALTVLEKLPADAPFVAQYQMSGAQLKLALDAGEFNK